MSLLTYFGKKNTKSTESIPKGLEDPYLCKHKRCNKEKTKIRNGRVEKPSPNCTSKILHTAYLWSKQNLNYKWF